MASLVYDVIVIGGGIIGASTAWHLQERHPKKRILLLEKEDEFGLHQTGRNSGVIHAGVYYEPGSLKARFCREGLSATLEFCRQNAIPHAQCGKLLIATDEVELERMGALLERCRRNGLDPELLDAAELRRREPNIRGLGAIEVRETGMVEFRRLCLRMLERFRELGGETRPGAEAVALDENDSGVTVATTAGRHCCGFLICCAGLRSDRLARMHGIDIDFRIVPFRGEFYRLPAARNALIRRHIYPIPDPSLPFVGVHLTRRIDGGILAGPNAVPGWKREGYGKFDFAWTDAMETLGFSGFRRLCVRHWRAGLRELRNSMAKSLYLRQVQRFCPDLKRDELLPHPTGIRAQALRSDGTLVHDFLFAETPRSLHVCNAPSPAATSAIPIGRYVCDTVESRL